MVNKRSLSIKKRLENLRNIFKNKNLEGILVSDPSNLSYLSGYSGTDAWIIVTIDSALFYTDFRNLERAQGETCGFSLRCVDSCLTEAIIKDLKANHLENTRIGVEGGSLTIEQFRNLQKKLPLRLAVTSKIVEDQRMIKDSYELSLICDACKIGAEAMNDALTFINSKNSGITEKNVKEIIELQMKKRGASGTSFETVVAEGKKTSMPHPAAPEDTVLKSGMVMLDFGARYEGYCSDLTRTFFLDRLGARFRIFKEIFKIVLEAQRTAIDLIHPGVNTSQIDKAARAVIEKAGYGKYFAHALGHGIGVAVHEQPRIGPASKVVLEEGMVFSVEPGIYLPGRGGVRIEDIVTVTPNGCRVLTNQAKYEV